MLFPNELDNRQCLLEFKFDLPIPVTITPTFISIFILRHVVKLQVLK